ncbi:MFS transporter [Streptomyces daghestanicus]|uniref:MFS transporter n=1 Tax=Streptomyces daghestanicus TaxID=66885 RepID=A0ABQ3PV04_9ACTN|nr:MFS transporter [Streptomyces daghestanicus]GGU41559.1 MFS transporter [Streptomyces daghestanicus]GHI28858.1 MFS transporter [Streptomyces daghestanicus]
MSTTPPSPPRQARPAAPRPDTAGHPAGEGALGWLRALGPQGRRAFTGAFGGYALDSYDYFTLPLSMVALAAYFGLDSGQTGLFTTVTLVVSAVGGALAGVLADRIGRVKALLLTVITYAVFTVACGFAPNYETLLVFRALQGLGFGGEWAVGAILVAEYASARHRGRALGAVQSAWAVGWALAAVVYTVVFSLADEGLAWRIMFWTGALPALLVVWVRRSVHDAPEASAARERNPVKGSFRAIFARGSVGTPGLLRTTLFAGLLSTGVQGGYYTLATWVPTYLKDERGLSVVGTGGYLTFLISGAFTGYLTGGHLTDRLGRRRNIWLFALLSAVCVLAYANIPGGAGTLLLVLGFPLGFCMSAIFSGFGSYLAELYPTAVRGTGQGFTYNTGRAVGAVFPTTVGFLADSWGVGGALVFGAIGYGVAALALLGLPETRGRELV